MFKSIKAVIFDMDGVVIDSEPLHQKSENNVYLRHGIKIDPADWDFFRGRTGKDIFPYVIEKYQASVTVEQLTKEVVAEYQKLADNDLCLFPDFFELIDFLKPEYRLALATSAMPENQRFAFKKFGLDNVFEVVVNAGDISRGKPDPEPYLITIEKLNLLPGQCLVIEDAVNGIVSGRSAGAKTIAVTTSFPQEKFSDADFVVDNLSEIKNILINNF